MYVCSPGATLVRVFDAAPPLTPTVPTTVVPSRKTTLPTGVSLALVTVADRVTVRPLAVAVSWVPVTIGATVTLPAKASETDPASVTASFGTKVAV